MKAIKAVVLILLTLTQIGCSLTQTPTKDKPRTLPWSQYDTSLAKSDYTVLDNGQIEITIVHQPLINISPKMLSWFYQHLPISSVLIGQEKLTWYHIFHHSEHGEIKILEPATDITEAGMGEGALVYRHEWFAEHFSKGAARVVEFNDNVMRVKPEVFGMHFGEITHRFEQKDGYTLYTLKALIGDDTPVISHGINYVLRNTQFTDPMIKQWMRHQKEEVANLNNFLVDLYKAPKQGRVYMLR